jgi:hypothetical protein
MCRTCFNESRTKTGRASEFDIDVEEPVMATNASTPTKVTAPGDVVWSPPTPDLHVWLAIPDTHRPYHAPSAVQLMLQAARAAFAPFAPSRRGIVIMGDYADCYAVSSHSKDPSRRTLLKDELADVAMGLDELDALGAHHKIYVEGNHETRISRLIADGAPGLAGLFTLPEHLRLHERGWQWVPYKHKARIGKLNVKHDLHRAGMNAHRQAINDIGQRNIAIGHTHRFGLEVQGDVDGGRHIGAVFGWLGDFDEVDYRHRDRALREWVHGFGLVYVDGATGNTHVQPVVIINDSCVVAGRLVTLDWREAA